MQIAANHGLRYIAPSVKHGVEYFRTKMDEKLRLGFVALARTKVENISQFRFFVYLHFLVAIC